MKILITGSRGFIGRNFCKYFKDEDLTLIDIKDNNDCRDFFKTSREVFDLVIHCAAVIGGRLEISFNPISVATNLSIDAEMFNWAVRTNQKKIVYFSSSAAYPVEIQNELYAIKESDIDLEHIKNPDMTYGWAKLTGEYLAKFARQKGIDVYVFRPFSGYGEDQDLDYPFPSFIQRAKNKENPFIIWGDGEQVRDFIHVDDLMRAVMGAVQLNIQEPINLGYGLPTSFNELAKIVCEIAGYSPEFQHLIDKPIGTKYRYCDNSKMIKFYTPKISLEDGIRRALYE